MKWLLRKDRSVVVQGGGKETVRKGRSQLHVPLPSGTGNYQSVFRVPAGGPFLAVPAAASGLLKTEVGRQERSEWARVWRSNRFPGKRFHSCRTIPAAFRQPVSKVVPPVRLPGVERRPGRSPRTAVADSNHASKMACERIGRARGQNNLHRERPRSISYPACH
jgi:hypothetical protein